jgi:hypothetical protein
MRRRLLTFLAIGLIGQLPPAKVWADDSNPFNAIHKIAVISALGNDIPMQTYGTTVFDSARYILHTNWDIDANTRDRVANILSSRFQIVENDIDPKLIFDYSSGFFDSPLDQLQKRVQALPKSPGIDAYVIIFPQTRSLGNQSWRGLQVTETSGWFGKSDTMMSAYYFIGIFDASTGKQIDYGTAKYAASGYIGGTSQPFVSCSSNIWASTVEALSEEQKEKIHEEFISLVDRGLLGALTSANIIRNDEASAFEQSHPSPADIPECHPI